MAVSEEVGLTGRRHWSFTIMFVWDLRFYDVCVMLLLSQHKLFLWVLRTLVYKIVGVAEILLDSGPLGAERTHFILQEQTGTAVKQRSISFSETAEVTGERQIKRTR